MLTVNLKSFDRQYYGLLLSLSESQYTTLTQASTYFKNKANSLLKFIKFIIFLPILCIVILFYVIVATFSRIYLFFLLFRIKAVKTDLEKKISQGVIPKEDSIKEHRLIKELLDKTTPTMQKFEKEPIVRPILEKLIKEIKAIEKISRVHAYPEYNAIDLSYDELTYLKNADVSF